MKFSCWLLSLLSVGGICLSGIAHADLQDDVEHLCRTVPRIYHLGPRILEQSDTLPLLVPKPLTPTKASECVHLVALSALGVQMTLSAPAASEDEDDVALPSRAGLLEIVHCGRPDESFSELALVMLSPRGVVDIVGYVNDRPKPEGLDRLPWRAAGVDVAEAALPHQIALDDINERLKRLERHARFNAADRTEQRPISSQDLESGALLVGFDPGCHELQLVVNRAGASDADSRLEPELVWIDDGESAQSNASSAASRTFRVCTAVARIARLSFNSAARNAKASLFRAHYPWPAGIPSNWSTQARSQMALTLFRRHLPALRSLPAQSWLGGSTPTSIVMPVASKSCYLAVVAASHGTQNDIALSVSADSRTISDTSLDDFGASVAFCVGQARSVKLAVDARGQDVVWILGVWSVVRGPLYTDLS